MRTAILWLSLLASVAACRAPSTPDGAALTAGLDVAYGVDAARPRTSFDLHIPPSGDAELFIGAMPDSADTVGHFRAPVAADKREALSRLVASKKLLSRSGGPSATAEGSGFLRIASGSDKAELSLVAADEGVTALRAKLDEILVEIARHPVRALRMTVGATGKGPSWHPEITLTQVGTEPFSVLFFDPENPVFCLRAEATAGAMGPAAELARTDVQNLVQGKALPAGVTSVPAGAVFHLPLTPVTAAPGPDRGGAELSGSVTFWIPGPGLSRRAVKLEARGAAR